MRRATRMGVLALAGTLGFVVLGIVGFHVLESATWSRAARWILAVVLTFDDGGYEPTGGPLSVLFISIWKLAAWVFWGLLAAALVVPPLLDWWHSSKNGAAVVSWLDTVGMSRVFILVQPVDWEKAESLVQEVHDQFGRRVLVVIVAEDLPDLPPHLLKAGCAYVKGNLRDPKTYRRAGLARASGVFVCARSYQDPAQDARSASLASLVEHERSDVETVVEQVSRGNDDLFDGRDWTVDARVVFDKETLRAIAERVSQIVPRGNSIRLVANTVDEAQAGELHRQLAARSIQIGEGGPKVRVILPANLDETTSDYAVWSELVRAKEEYVVALFLSVLSEGLFRHNPSALCADRIMAKALVEAMRETI
ncbi:MAG: hypothetical protein AAB483_02325 [Patescibacteria group bacterium]